MKAVGNIKTNTTNNVQERGNHAKRNEFSVARGVESRDGQRQIKFVRAEVESRNCGREKGTIFGRVQNFGETWRGRRKEERGKERKFQCLHSRRSGGYRREQ